MNAEDILHKIVVAALKFDALFRPLEDCWFLDHRALSVQGNPLDHILELIFDLVEAAPDEADNCPPDFYPDWRRQIFLEGSAEVRRDHDLDGVARRIIGELRLLVATKAQEAGKGPAHKRACGT